MEGEGRVGDEVIDVCSESLGLGRWLRYELGQGMIVRCLALTCEREINRFVCFTRS